jgi:hypothetical protein
MIKNYKMLFRFFQKTGLKNTGEKIMHPRKSLILYRPLIGERI